MSIPSLYRSGDDEEELFRLTDPNEHPGSSDESVARQEEESLASSHYDEAQAEFDEQVEPAHLEVVLQEFSDEELSEVVRLIEDIQNRREEGG
jgi:hypothetical protein